MQQRPTLTINNVTFGDGKVKICLPEVEKSEEAILKTIKGYEKLSGWDVLEVRLDFFDQIHDANAIKVLLNKVRQATSRLMLVTLRTKREGSALDVNDEDYLKIITSICESGVCDLVDIELTRGDDLIKQCEEVAHAHNVKVIISKHDFDKTPSQNEMESLLYKMNELSGDILKLAVMPHDKADVIELLGATRAVSTHVHAPLITMSMGNLGSISRVIGGEFGSTMSFATAGKASAPGQVSLEKMSGLLKGVEK